MRLFTSEHGTPVKKSNLASSRQWKKAVPVIIVEPLVLTLIGCATRDACYPLPAARRNVLFRTGNSSSSVCATDGVTGSVLGAELGSTNGSTISDATSTLPTASVKSSPILKIP